ncbi:MAG: hypothetical protein NTX16_05145 [Actinobacteria bacterium]|nr:hypothetical protein [Actinomycetota bacterium]
MRHTGSALAAAVALVALSLVAVGACGGDGGGRGGGGTPPPAAAADITGRLSQFSAVADGTTSFLVVADANVSGPYDRAMVRTTADTVVWTLQGEVRRRLAATDLRDGLRVAVRFTGPVAESYPEQAVAAGIEVLPAL